MTTPTMQLIHRIRSAGWNYLVFNGVLGPEGSGPLSGLQEHGLLLGFHLREEPTHRRKRVSFNLPRDMHRPWADDFDNLSS